MGRAALIGLLAVCIPLPARANPVSLQLGAGTGVAWASRAGAYRDDGRAGVRLGVGVGPFVAIDVALAEDLERLEPAFGVGVRVRPFAGACWTQRWSPYLRGQVSLVGATHLGSNYDVLVGAGHWGRLADHVAWFVELDVVARVGELDTVAARLDTGLALTTSSFW